MTGLQSGHELGAPTTMLDATSDALQAETPPSKIAPAQKGEWVYALLRVTLVSAICFLAWYIAGHWSSWTGSARRQWTDDAYIAGDVTALAAKVSGYVALVAVDDFQIVHKGDLIVEIEASDYRDQLQQAEASLAASQATLANLANQKDVQNALIQQAEATILATSADLQRYRLEAERQRRLQSRLAGTSQLVEQAEDNEKRTSAQLSLNNAQLDQQKALRASLDEQEKLLHAQVRAAEAQAALARNNLGYTKIVSPADGMVSLRQVRPGQFINVGAQVIAVVPLPNVWVIANYKETQMTDVRLGDPARVTVDAFPNLALTGHVGGWSPGTGSTFTLLPPDNATGNFTKVVQRVPVKIVLDPNPSLGSLLRPGMSVEASIDTRAAGSNVPTTSLTKTAGDGQAAQAPALRR
jgi:membrane fusion protein (multidrug efflux system)